MALNKDKTLLVPIHLDTLFVSDDSSPLDVKGPSLDFTKMPSHGNDKSKSGAFLSETLRRSDSDSISLYSGLHLHWALPDALTKSMELRVIRQSAFGEHFPEKMLLSIWSAMKVIGWIREISTGIGVSLKLDERLKLLEKEMSSPSPVIAKDSPLLTHLEQINLILDQPSLPPAPNRWVVTKFSDPDDDPDNSWYIESDYQYPIGSEAYQGEEPRVAFPYFKEIVKENDPNFNPDKAGNYLNDPNYRYTGRNTNCDDDLSGGLSGMNDINLEDYTSDPLSALGYGDPEFAAFYPNCINIFGLRDGDVEGSPDGEYYEVMGWHSDPELDYYGLFIQDFKAQNKGDNIDLLRAINRQFRWLIPITIQKSDLASIKATIGRKPENAWDYLIKELQWLEKTKQGTYIITPVALDPTAHLPIQFKGSAPQILKVLTDAIDAQLPTRMICYARRAIKLKGVEPTQINASDIEVVVGHTGAEAMAALVAKTGETKLSNIAKNQEQIEDQLAALLNASKLTGKQQDVGAKLAEARHDNGFLAENGGTIWTIRPKSSNDLTKGQESTSEVTLPIVFADLLNKLNLAQQILDEFDFKIRSTQNQIYLDWCKFQSYRYSKDKNEIEKSNFILDYILDEKGKVNNKQSTTALVEMLLKRNTLLKNVSDIQNQIRQELLNNHQIGFEDVIGWASLLNELQQQAYIKLPAPFAAKLQTYKPYQLTDQEQLSILDALDDIIEQPTFPLAITPDKLPEKALAIWNNRPKDEPYQSFNRALLGSLFANLKKSTIYILQAKAAPRFWRPRDPVVLFNGDGLTPNTRNGNDGELECQSFDFTLTACGSKLKTNDNWYDAVVALYNKTHAELSTLKTQLPGSFAFADQTTYPAHPLLLDWTVQFHQAKNTSPQDPDYQQNYITTNYQLESNQVDYTLVNTELEEAPGALSGRTILTSYASGRLQNAVKDYLLKKFPTSDYTSFFAKDVVIKVFSGGKITTQAGLKPKLDDFIGWCQSAILIKQGYFTARSVAVSQQDDYYIEEHINDFEKWLSTESTIKSLYKPAKRVLNFQIIIAQLQAEIANTYQSVIYIFCDTVLKNKKVVSQSLGGLHDAMLMERFDYQLGVYNPVAFLGHTNLKENQLYIDQHRAIRNATGIQNITSPEGSSDFNPIRAGGLLPFNLTLIDTFGQTLFALNTTPVIEKQLTISSPMTMEANLGYVGLNPRYAQAAQLNFRFLSASDEAVEMNDHIATSPVCGWLLPNLLDGSLVVYGQNGQALGYVDQTGQWQVYPGKKGPLYPDAIPNKTLGEVVRWLCKNAYEEGNFSSFMNDFMSTLANGIEHADPEGFAHHQELALLMGRPLAVIKTSLELKLKGRPATNQSPTLEFSGDDPTKYKRTTHQFEEVKIPVRLGEYEQLNDGLIGYWVETPQSDNIFYAPQTEAIDDPRIKTRAKNKDHFNVAINASQQPQLLTMIVEPQGGIHATSGVLPAKQIQIPPDQYAQALKNIEIAFLTAPLISTASQLNISLPKEAGYEWSWMQQTNENWNEVSENGRVKQSDMKAEFPTAWLSLWNQLLLKGWLGNDTATTALITPRDQRKAAVLDDSFISYEDKIEHWFQQHQLFSFNTKANFNDNQVIKEGWLQLKKEVNS